MTIADEVLACEDRRRAAVVERNLATLAALLADDLLYVHSDGHINSKADYLALVEDRSVSFIRIEHSDMTVKIGADMAILAAATAIEAESAGVVHERRTRTINVWQRGGDGWQQIAWQATQLLHVNG